MGNNWTECLRPIWVVGLAVLAASCSLDNATEPNVMARQLGVQTAPPPVDDRPQFVVASMIGDPLAAPQPVPLGESAPRQGKARLHVFAGWRLDTVRRELRRADGTLVPMTDTEFDLLGVFAEMPQRVLSRDQLLDRLRGRVAQAFDRSIDVAVMRLRRKIEADPAHPELIKTVRNGGYVFTPEVEAPAP